MKAITLHQPWASLIADGRKTIETRSWVPPKRMIGQRIAIHAGQKVDKAAAQEWGCAELHVGAVVATAKLAAAYRVVRVVDISAGGGLAVCVSAYAESEPLFLDIDAYGDFGVGRALWMLDDVERTMPVAAIGKLGLWDLESGLATAFLADLDSPITAVLKGLEERDNGAT